MGQNPITTFSKPVHGLRPGFIETPRIGKFELSISSKVTAYQPIVDSGGGFLEEGGDLFFRSNEAAQLNRVKDGFRLEFGRPPALVLSAKAVVLVISTWSITQLSWIESHAAFVRRINPA